MAVIALASASGAPGVTTTALGLALSWPRPILLIEADPTGGSGLLAGFFRGSRQYETGLIELALAPDGVANALHDVARPIDGTQVSFIAGTRSHSQAAVLRELWQPLSEALVELESTGQDVLVDAGRLGLVGSPEPLLASADLALLVTRTSLPALAAARSWADTVRRRDIGWRQPGALLVGEGQPYRAAEVTKVLGLPVVAGVLDDREAAAVYHRGATAPRRFSSGGYARGLVAAIESIHARVARSRLELLEEVSR